MSVGPDIIEFATGKRYLGKSYLSPHQRAILRGLYGLEFPDEELKAFLELTEGRYPRKGGYQDAALICGTRGGKTDLAAIVATYESVRLGPAVEEVLMPGQVATGILIAKDRRQAGIARGYIEGNLNTLEENGFSVLAESQGQGRAITGALIRLAWPIEIVIFPANKASVRGFTGLWFLGDEIAYWDFEEGKYNQDKEVIRAVRSRFATLARLKPKKIILSSPHLKEGVLWEEYKKRETSKTLVVKAPTWLLNPQIEKDDPTFFDVELEKDPEAYQRDYAAEFAEGSGGNTFLPPEIVDQCVERGRQQNAPESGVDYLAWMDAAFKEDRFSFGIGHARRTSEETRAVIDHLRHWTPPKKKGRHLNPEEIVPEIVADLRAYGIDRIHGDQFSDVTLKTMFAKAGIVYVEVPTTRPEKWDAYKNLRGGLRAGLVHLPDDPVLKKELKGLIKKESQTGHPIVMAPRRRHAYDDMATVVSRLVFKLLPLANAIDIHELNRGAMPERFNRGLDWDPRKYDGGGYSETDLGSAFEPISDMVM